jgi:hypothetical protein
LLNVIIPTIQHHTQHIMMGNYDRAHKECMDTAGDQIDSSGILV